MLHIGIDARFYGSLGKGLGRYTEKLIENLEILDTENEYTIFLRCENFEEYQPKNPRFKKVVAQYAWYGIAEQTFFVFLLYRYALDLVHFPHFNVPVLYRRRFLVTIHDLILIHYPTRRNTTHGWFLYAVKFFVYRFVIASAIRRATHIITVSQFTARDIEKYYPFASGKITVTYEAADAYCRYLPPEKEKNLLTRLRIISPERVEAPDQSHDILRSYFLYVGNAYPHKNLPVLFEVAKMFPQYLLVFVGKEDYFYRRLKRQVKQVQLKNVLFTGFLTDSELSTLYRLASLYLFPSLYEGFGLPPLEAMTHGTVVVSSNRGSLPEILGEAAVYFDPTDTHSLCKVVQNLLENKSLQESLRVRGYERSVQFRFQEMAAATHRLYVSLCEKKK